MTCQAVGCASRAPARRHRLPGFQAAIYLCDDCARKRRATPLEEHMQLVGSTLTLKTTDPPAGICRIEGCHQTTTARGLCAAHHSAAMRAGTLEALALPWKARTRPPQKRPPTPEPQHPAVEAGTSESPAPVHVDWIPATGPAPALLCIPPSPDTLALREAAVLLGIGDYDDGGEMIREAVTARTIELSQLRPLVGDLRESLKAAEKAITASEADRNEARRELAREMARLKVDVAGRLEEERRERDEARAALATARNEVVDPLARAYLERAMEWKEGRPGREWATDPAGLAATAWEAAGYPITTPRTTEPTHCPSCSVAWKPDDCDGAYVPDGRGDNFSDCLVSTPLYRMNTEGTEPTYAGDCDDEGEVSDGQ